MPRFAFLASLLLLAPGCDGDPPAADGGSLPRDAGSDMDGGAGGMDAGTPEPDAGAPVDAAVPSSDAAEGALCAFNRECGATQRCECDEATGCACVTGPRGTGALGDPCTDGNDCASSVCVEGPDGAFYCTEECADEGDCAEPLPRCIDVTFVGRICARQPS